MSFSSNRSSLQNKLISTFFANVDFQEMWCIGSNGLGCFSCFCDRSNSKEKGFALAQPSRSSQRGARTVGAGGSWFHRSSVKGRERQVRTCCLAHLICSVESRISCPGNVPARSGCSAPSVNRIKILPNSHGQGLALSRQLPTSCPEARFLGDSGFCQKYRVLSTSTTTSSPPSPVQHSCKCISFLKGQGWLNFQATAENSFKTYQQLNAYLFKSSVDIKIIREVSHWLSASWDKSPVSSEKCQHMGTKRLTHPLPHPWLPYWSLTPSRIRSQNFILPPPHQPSHLCQ